MRTARKTPINAVKPTFWLTALALATIILSACAGETITPTATTVSEKPAPTSTPTTDAETPEIPVTISQQQMSGTAPLTIQFSVLDAPGIVSAEWDFGDGNTSTELAPDLSSATIQIKQGVHFQIVEGIEFGNMTAHDVAFAMNEANALTNTASQHRQAGDFAGLFNEWVAVDDFTIQFDFVSFDSSWADEYINHSGEAFSVFSKSAFEIMGQEWVRNRIVATGIYRVEEWIADDHITLVRRPNHHQFVAKTERIELYSVPDATVRNAVLRGGDVDMADLEVKEASGLIFSGFVQTSTGYSRQLGVFFSGNLWENYYASGEFQGQILPTKATFVHDIPWIGSPGKHGSDDLEQAKAIRRAMAMAIDREKVNRDVLGGLGTVNHVVYFSTNHPNWESRYEYPYDPAGAIALIKAQDNDYQHGSAPSNGVLGDHAFEVSVYAGPELGGGRFITGDIADAVAGFWSAIGLTTFTLKYSYQTFRPGVVGCTNALPWVTSCDKGNGGYPWQSPKGLVQTTLTRGGFSCGFESPVILNLYSRMVQAPNAATATAVANEYLEYVYDQVLQPGVVEVPFSYYFNPRKIKSFQMEKSNSASLTALWNIELQ